MYGLRRQALLVKKAKYYGVEELLPYCSKSTSVKNEKRESQGLRVKGTGVGQKVKGKEWERTQKGRLEGRRVAMMKMPEMVRQWKEVSILVSCFGLEMFANIFSFTERTWSWLEEVAEMISKSASWRWSFAMERPAITTFESMITWGITALWMCVCVCTYSIEGAYMDSSPWT